MFVLSEKKIFSFICFSPGEFIPENDCQPNTNGQFSRLFLSYILNQFFLLFSILSETDFVLAVAIIACLLRFTNGAPTEKRHTRRHLAFYDHYQTPPAWVNPCGVDLFNVSRVVSSRLFFFRFIGAHSMQKLSSDLADWCLTAICHFHHGHWPGLLRCFGLEMSLNSLLLPIFCCFTQAKALKPLREEIKRFITSLNSSSMQSIDTSDISRWFTKNATYQFLHRINPSTFNVSIIVTAVHIFTLTLKRKEEGRGVRARVTDRVRCVLFLDLGHIGKRAINSRVHMISSQKWSFY